MPTRTSTPLTAADAMTVAPRTCSTFSTVLEAVMIFRDADCGAVPVLDDGKTVGVLTDRDVALALTEFEERLPGTPVGEVMTKDVISVRPEAKLDDVIEQFGNQRVRRLLVIDDQNRLVGILSWSDIAPFVGDSKVGQAVSEVVEKP